MLPNLKCDIAAKQALVLELRQRGYDQVSITQSPADVTAKRDGEAHYFEVKYTTKQEYYFGAATLTEWEAALANEGRYTFVIASQQGSRWVFIEYTPDEFMKFNTIVPFKTYFRINVKCGRDTRVGSRGRAVSLTRDRLLRMAKLFEEFRHEKSR
jgi:hypothetical protein